MPYKKQKAIRSNKKVIIYDLMTDLGLTQIDWISSPNYSLRAAMVFNLAIYPSLKIDFNFAASSASFSGFCFASFPRFTSFHLTEG